jgi:hypothetical protein
MNTDDTSWICGLMRLNTDALGFVPQSTVYSQYVRHGRYIMQTDAHGRNVGYLLHGAAKPGCVLTVAQHCIDNDKRLQGFGRVAFETLLDRAVQANCKSIRLKCAEELPSNEFWRGMGFDVIRVDHPVNRRKRAINVYWLDLRHMVAALPLHI